MGTIDYMTDVATVGHIRFFDPMSTRKHTEADFDDALDIGGRVGLVSPLR